jgi:peptidoglycan/xylan/chitin deacetylase (PgdA/CDA1 family)
MRAIARRPAAALLATAARRAPLRAGLVLVYHRLDTVPGDPDREVLPAIGAASFEAHLRHLRSHYLLVPASALPEAAAARQAGEPYPAAVTFDDDLLSHERIAAPILTRLGIPATFFLTGAALDAPFSFWWEDLERAASSGRLTPRDGTLLTPRAVASVLGGEPRAARELARRITRLGPDERDRVRVALREMAGPLPSDTPRFDRASAVRLARAGFEIGFHTAAHEPLTTLGGDGLAAALRDGRARLEAAVEREVSVIAYPHGDADGRVAQAARVAGWRLGFTMEPRLVRPGDDPWLLGRIAPPAGDPARLAMGLSRRVAVAAMGRVGRRR